METILSLLVGLGLSAACGFRVFVPLLVVSIASRTGHVTLASGFAWLSTDAALIALTSATILEITAYFIPWLGHLLDTLATPAAVIAGAIITGSLVTGMSPFLKWSLAVIAGGGIAGLVQTTTVMGRMASTAVTGGLGNPIFAAAELGGALIVSVLSLLLPVFSVVLIVGLVAVVWIKFANRPRAVPKLE